LEGVLHWNLHVSLSHEHTSKALQYPSIWTALPTWMSVICCSMSVKLTYLQKKNSISVRKCNNFQAAILKYINYLMKVWVSLLPDTSVLLHTNVWNIHEFFCALGEICLLPLAVLSWVTGWCCILQIRKCLLSKPFTLLALLWQDSIIKSVLYMLLCQETVWQIANSLKKQEVCVIKVQRKINKAHLFTWKKLSVQHRRQ
jgi:hypothetical protein